MLSLNRVATLNKQLTLKQANWLQVPGLIKLNYLPACYGMVSYHVWIFDNIPQARVANDMRLPNSYIVWFIDMLYSSYWILECKDSFAVGFPIKTNRTHLTWWDGTILSNRSIE